MPQKLKPTKNNVTKKLADVIGFYTQALIIHTSKDNPQFVSECIKDGDREAHRLERLYEEYMQEKVK